jgi:hypothetical protein
MKTFLGKTICFFGVCCVPENASENIFRHLAQMEDLANKQIFSLA